MVRVSADSTCDLSPELIARYGLEIAPLYIVRDGESLRDGMEIRPQDIFDYVDKTGKLLKTSAVSVEDYISLFRRLTQDGSEVVHITIQRGNVRLLPECLPGGAGGAGRVPGGFAQPLHRHGPGGY